MKTSVYLFALLLAGWTFQACNNSPRKTKDSVETAEKVNDSTATVKEDDSEFLVKAASGGMMEVQLGQFAQANSSNQRVKDFGAMMVRDHSKANEELKALAASKNVTLPATLGEDHQKHVDHLKGLKGDAFDKSYINMMVDDHKDDIKEFEDASEDAADADVKTFAGKTLPILRVHLDSAQVIHKTLNLAKAPRTM